MKEEVIDNLVPEKIWFTLSEVCVLKNLSYKTACNKTYLQPNNGKSDATIGGKKMFSRQTVLKWVCLSDLEMARGERHD